jgi:hypothetical protein
MRRRRTFLAALSFAALTAIVGAAACTAAGPSPAVKPLEALPASGSNEAAKPASAPTAAPRPAATSVAANRPAADAAASRASMAAESATGGTAAQAAPARPAAPAAQPAPGVVAPPRPAPTPSQPAEPAAIVPAQVGRKVIYTTDVAILVTSPSQLVSTLGDLAEQAGGYVAGVENKDEGGVPVTTVRLKIPPERYEATMRQIRSLAVEVTAEKAATQDVTEEFSDVQTQLATLEASHAQLLELLKQAQNMDEVLKIQEKAAQTKAQIDRLKGRQTFLERSTEFATVTVAARPADEVLARTYSALRSSLRRSEAQRAQTVAAIQRSRTPEEEATLRDRLGEITLEIERLTARIADVESKAQAASITLPAPAQDDPTVAAASDQDIVREYLRLIGERRAAEADRDRLTREQRSQPSPDRSAQLQQALVQVATLDTQVKAIEERARRASIALPNVTSEQIAALAGLPQETWWSRLDAGWAVVAVVAAVIVAALALMIGRRLRRRPAGPVGPVGPAPSPAA